MKYKRDPRDPRDPLTTQYYSFMRKLKKMKREEGLQASYKLLQDIEDSGQFLVNPEQRSILDSMMNSISSKIFDLSGTLPWRLLAYPLDVAWEIDPQDITQAQLQAYILMRCHRTLYKLREFDYDALLRPLFDSPLLARHVSTLPQATNKGERVDRTVAYLLQKQLSCHGPVLLEFLALLRNREPSVSGLRDELELLHCTMGQLLLRRAEAGFEATPEPSSRTFINRESERKTIRSWLLPDFYVQLHAPVGYGKSTLMRQVAREVENFLWLPVWIDFASESHRPLRNDCHLFLDAFCQQVPCPIPNLLSLDLESAVAQIGNKLSGIDQEVILFLDHLQSADEKLLEWLAEAFLVKLATQWVPVRVLAASQVVIKPWQQMTGKRSFRLLPLSPLDERCVRGDASDVAY